MKKRIGITAVVIVAVVVIVLTGHSMTHVETGQELEPEIVQMTADIIMPTKVSRPGCEQENRCYIPHSVIINTGESVSWLNDDSAFHSVTSGAYGSPTGLFDSGYMDPGDVFSHVFVESGQYIYHCTLHEWMYGVIIVN